MHDVKMKGCNYGRRMSKVAPYMLTLTQKRGQKDSKSKCSKLIDNNYAYCNSISVYTDVVLIVFYDDSGGNHCRL